MKKTLLNISCILALLMIIGVPPVAGASRPTVVDKQVPVPARDVELARKVQIKGEKGSGKPPRTTPQAATGELGEGASGKKFAIVVGISNYPGTANDLEYCDDDARDMIAALNGYGFDSITPFIDSEDSSKMVATRTNIITAIEDLAGQVYLGDEVVFFFSGHGGRGRADDYDSEKIDECIWVHDSGSLVPIWDGELAALFQNFDTDRIVFIFDSCYAGGMNDLKAAGRIVAMASTENSLSYELSNLGNGEFTYNMIEQGMISHLADKYDSIKGYYDVTIEEAWDYAKLNCRYDSITLSDSFTGDLLP